MRANPFQSKPDVSRLVERRGGVGAEGPTGKEADGAASPAKLCGWAGNQPGWAGWPRRGLCAGLRLADDRAGGPRLGFRLACFRRRGGFLDQGIEEGDPQQPQPRSSSRKVLDIDFTGHGPTADVLRRCSLLTSKHERMERVSVDKSRLGARPVSGLRAPAV